MAGLTSPYHLSGCSAGQALTPECEVVEIGEGDLEKLFDDCKKNPGHKNFIPVNEFSIEHLPERLRTKEMMNFIRERVDRTVLVRVPFTSPNRPDIFSDSKAPYPFSNFRGRKKRVRYGTGSIIRLMSSLPIRDRQCPCHICKSSGNPKSEYWEVSVNTATHVIYDNSEAERAVFKCFFDSDDEKGVETLYGVCIDGFKSHKQLFQSDVCDVVVCVTHERRTVAKISSRIRSVSVLHGVVQPPGEVIVSHPHGCSKRISIGNILYMTIPIKPKYRTNEAIYFRDGTKCHLLSESTKEAVSTEFSEATNKNGYKLYGKKTMLHDLLENMNKFSHLDMLSHRVFTDAAKHYKETSAVTKATSTTGKCIYLPTGTTFTLPLDAQYAMRYYSKTRFRFPTGTKITSPNGKPVSIPDGAEFENAMLFHQHYNVSYDIDTCPGSSGAIVYLDWLEDTYVPHSGWDCAENCNRSGVYNNVFMPAVSQLFQDMLN